LACSGVAPPSPADFRPPAASHKLAPHVCDLRTEVVELGAKVELEPRHIARDLALAFCERRLDSSQPVTRVDVLRIALVLDAAHRLVVDPEVDVEAAS
jgi:hypothetical protein